MTDDPIVLELEKCVVREWKRGDEPSLVRHANNRKIWLNLRDSFPHPYTMGDARRWIDLATKKLRGNAFAVCVGGFAVGAIGVFPRDDVNRHSAEIGYWLGEEFWAQGITTEAVVAMTDYGFRSLGLFRIFAEVFEWNRASMRVLEKAGYEAEGRLRNHALKDGRLIDQILYAITVEAP
jgi:ribosomal-protein-alanine N-acetyltransferase